MNIAIIFAGGTGTRMKTKDKPKQFLAVHGKPIIVHTLDVFQKHQEIDGIIVSCIGEWIPYMEELAYYYRLDKIKAIVQGGDTGQLSIYNGLKEAEKIYGLDQHIVLIHDGVRPLITDELITRNIETVKKYGNSVTCSSAQETFVILNEEKEVSQIPQRDLSKCAKAPQCFYLKDLLEKHELALADGYNNMIDSCTLMRHYGMKLAVTECGTDNIKITTPNDFYIFRALYDARENQQLSE